MTRTPHPPIPVDTVALTSQRAGEAAGLLPRGLSIWALPGIPEVSEGDDLVALISAAAADRPLQDGDVLVVTSKVPRGVASELGSVS